MKYHDITTGKKAPKSRALDDAKSIKPYSPGRIRSESEMRSMLGPKTLQQYDRQKAERSSGTAEHTAKTAQTNRYKDWHKSLQDKSIRSKILDKFK